MPLLYSIVGSTSGQSFPLTDFFSIGRTLDNSLVCQEEKVSRKHALIQKEEMGYYLRDLNSGNGTLLNGERIRTKIVLRDGDEIRIGKNLFLFVINLQNPETLARIKKLQEEYQKESFTPLPKELKAIQKTKLLIPRNTPPPLSLEDQHSLLLKILNTFSKSRDLLVLCEEGLGHLIDTSLIYQSTLFLWEEDHKKLIPQATRYAEAEKVEDIPLESGRLEKALEENQISLQELEQEEPLTSVVIPLNLQNSNLGALSLVFFREKIEVTSSLFPFLIALSNQFVLGIYGVQENQKYIKTAEQLEKLSKFVSPEVFQSILKTKDIGIRVENTLCTILFSDIQGFTSMSERLHPPRIAALLNEYFSLMVEILFRYNGSLDKFIGDAIMAIFGAPLSREDDAERAIYAAIEMQRAIHGMNQKRSEGERFHVRIGINTGYCVAGRIGSYQRMEYTVLGDTVNIASRIESNGKAGHIMIGEATHALIGPQFEVVELNPLKVKNKNNPIRTFDVLYPLP